MQQLPQLDELTAFTTLAETGSFTVTARRLGRDPTAVSRRIRALEAHLAIRLVERTTRSVRLTEAGSEYLASISPLLEQLAAAGRNAASLGSGTPRGHLRISLPATFGRLWLSPLIDAFLTAQPEVTIEAEFSNRFVDLVGEKFDLAVRLAQLPDSRLIARKIAERHRLVCAAPSYLARAGVPTSPQALAGHACLRFTGKINPRHWEFTGAEGERIDVSINGPLASDDAEVLRDSALAGHGLLLASDWLVSRELAVGTLVRVLEDWAIPNEGGIYIVLPSIEGLPSKSRAFADFIAGQIGDGPPWIDRRK